MRLLRCARNDGINRPGAALLVVLFVVMVVTVLSLGFLSRSDVELACGGNMILRTQMDYLAESGLEHARGLILNPQDVKFGINPPDKPVGFWTGAVGQQLAAGSDDYYDIKVVRDDSVPTNRCNYIIDCNSYRLKAGEKVGHTSLEAELRLDPCIAYWAGGDTTISQRITVNGDVYCNGTLIYLSIINGDVFANSLTGNPDDIVGQQEVIEDLSLQWPQVTVGDFTSRYTVQSIGSTLSGVTYGPYDPVQVCYNGGGDVELAGNVQIYGMLVVEGDLTIRAVLEGGNVITAGKNLPALLVTGDLKVENGGCLDIDGLAVVEGEVQISADSANLNINGGLFTHNGIVETTTDSSGNGNDGTLTNMAGGEWTTGFVGGALEFDGNEDYVTIAESSDFKFGTGDFGMGAWVKTSATTTSYIIDNYQGTVGEVGCQIVMNADGTVYFEVRGGTLLQITSTTTINDGAWHHIFGSADRDTQMNLYIDGAIAAPTGGTNSDKIDNSNPVLIGVNTWQSDPLGSFFSGIIDDVRIYNHALEPNDVNDIYHLVGGPGGLVGHWKLDEDGSSNVSITAAPSKTAIVVWPGGVAEKWGSAAGAFFRSIRRK